MTTCPACGAPAVTGGVCARCGYASGEENRCPHCKAVARAEPKVKKGSVSWVCAMCGGPRVPGGAGGSAAGVALREAKGALSAATRARARSIAWSMLAVLATLVVLAAAHGAAATLLVLMVLAIVPALLAARAFTEARKRESGAGAAMDRAWLAAAEDVARRSPTGVTAAELAKALQIEETRADRLLTELAVHEKTRIDVGDEAEVRYSVAPDVLAAAESEMTSDVDAEGSQEMQKRKELRR